MINEPLAMRVNDMLTSISEHPGWLVSPFLVSTLIIDLWNELINSQNEVLRLRRIVQDMTYKDI